MSMNGVIILKKMVLKWLLPIEGLLTGRVVFIALDPDGEFSPVI